ncbi:MAG: 50S ribosomal protein L10, partial [bacterium]|nr:50S ribosomal protein L10 [bacterium]
MPLTKEEKKQIIEELKEKIDRQKSIVFADFTGLEVKDLSNLRKKIKKQNGELKVAKKTLISLALKEKNIKFNAKQLQGEVVMGFGYKDEISPFKIIYDFSKVNDKLKILGGLIAGEFYDK